MKEDTALSSTKESLQKENPSSNSSIPAVTSPRADTINHDFVLSSPLNQSTNINEKDGCFTPLSFSQKSTLSFSQEYIPIYHYHEQMKQLTISLFSVDNSDEEVSAPSSQQENSSFPSRKAIITGIYKKLYAYLEEEITKIQNPVLEKKTPAKMTINRIPVCPPLKRANRKATYHFHEDENENHVSKVHCLSF